MSTPGNRTLAAIFEQMADLSDLQGASPFKAISYQKAARVLEQLTDEAAELSAGELQKLEGIGKSTATRIVEFGKSGQIKAHQDLLAAVPPGVLKLLKVPGLGPKTVAALWQQGGVTDTATLLNKLRTGELENIKGLGKKKLEQVQQNLKFAESAGQRSRLGVAMPLAEALVEAIEGLPGVDRVAYAGSLRRGAETIGDLDVLAGVDAEHAASVMDVFVNHPLVGSIILRGDTKASVRLHENAGGQQADLRVVPPDRFGAAWMYFTGSKEHNVAMRERAIRMGLRLNEYGLWPALPDDAEDDARPQDAPGAEPVAAASEQEVYDALHLAWVAPELREDRGELAAAAEAFDAGGTMPPLVEIADIQSDLHTHTLASDGKWTIHELAEHAAKQGYHTVAITDHSKGQVQANGLTEDRLVEHIEAVRVVAKELKDTISVLAGSEVDILTDGRLDYAEELLAELDIVVASPHASLRQDPKKATARMLRAIENPYVTILGHPTGRLVGRREGLSPDMPALCKAAADRGIAMEINANDYRLDLRDSHARLALEHGVKLSINTDAHAAVDMTKLRYGILTARRAGATAADVVNTYDAADLATWIQSTRGR
jgi:DNA polymerase (family 10)